MTRQKKQWKDFSHRKIGNWKEYAVAEAQKRGVLMAAEVGNQMTLMQWEERTLQVVKVQGYLRLHQYEDRHSHLQWCIWEVLKIDPWYNLHQLSLLSWLHLTWKRRHYSTRKCEIHPTLTSLKNLLEVECNLDQEGQKDQQLTRL